MGIAIRIEDLVGTGRKPELVAAEAKAVAMWPELLARMSPEWRAVWELRLEVSKREVVAQPFGYGDHPDEVCYRAMCDCEIEIAYRTPWNEGDKRRARASYVDGTYGRGYNDATIDEILARIRGFVEAS